MGRRRTDLFAFAAVGGLGLGACTPQDTPEAALESATQALGFCGEPLCFLAPDTLLNTTVAGAQDTPVVATTPDGNTLLVFRDRSGLTADAANGDTLRGRIFARTGLHAGGDFLGKKFDQQVRHLGFLDHPAHGDGVRSSPGSLWLRGKPKQPPRARRQNAGADP